MNYEQILQAAKDEVAKSYGYKNWDDLFDTRDKKGVETSLKNTAGRQSGYCHGLLTRNMMLWSLQMGMARINQDLHASIVAILSRLPKGVLHFQMGLH